LSAGNPKLASAFIPKCTNVTPQERVEMWVKCGMVGKAAEEAGKARDVKMLEQLKDKARPGEREVVERILEGLKK
jgi:hypothetical protein